MKKKIQAIFGIIFIVLMVCSFTPYKEWCVKCYVITINMTLTPVVQFLFQNKVDRTTDRLEKVNEQL